MTRDEAIRKVRAMREIGARPGTPAEGESARRLAAELAREHGLTEAEIRGQADPRARRGGDRVNVGGASTIRVGGIFVEFDGIIEDLEAAHGDIEEAFSILFRSFARGTVRRAAPSEQVLRDHKAHPDRVHMAIDNMRSVCGVGPTFVWTYERAIALKSGRPCPHCMDTNIIDARKPTERLNAASSSRPRRTR